jgi:hypothetical protein
MTGGYRLKALLGFLKLMAISCPGLLAIRENSWFLAIGSSPAPRRSEEILASPWGFLKRLVGESFD